MIGKTISHYKILEKLGEGGMGVVYKAEDTKLNITVALKFLPTNKLGTDEEKQRFEQEAKAAAQLNHPNIATIYEINEHEGETFIAMEYIEGETISDKVKTRPMKIKDAIKIAQQIAEGLHSAHEVGIVHRDIKSANIMLTKKGVVKIMDFGLAKMSKASMLTKAGTTLGTISYMSPEQSQGEKVDHRADIWSLGIVFYEMISGQLPFKGEYESAIIYSIMNENPEPLTAVRSGVPMDLEKIVNKLLAKEPDERYQNIIELPVDLKNVSVQETDASQIGSSVLSETINKKKEASPNRSITKLIPWAITAGLGIALVLLLVRESPDPPRPLTASLIFEKGAGPLVDRHLALSPDATKLAYVTSNVFDGSKLWIRDLANGSARALLSTEGAKLPFWSPDGSMLGYFANQQLFVVPASSGAPIPLAPAPQPLGGTWNTENIILYSPTVGPLFQIPAAGGTPTQVTHLAHQGEIHGSPVFLPDGRHFLFWNNGINKGDLQTGQIEHIRQGAGPVYVDSGFLVFHLGSNAFAQRFDPKHSVLSGQPLPVLSGLTTPWGRAAMSVTSQMIAFVPRDQFQQSNPLIIGRNGAVLDSLVHREGGWVRRFSHDGKRVAIGGDELWVHDLARKVSEPVPTELTSPSVFAWSPDDSSIVYQSLQDRGQLRRVWVTSAAKEEVIFQSNVGNYIASLEWSPDGRIILFVYGPGEIRTLWELWACTVAKGSAIQLLKGSFNVYDARFAPNGQWFAYTSDEGSNTRDVYLRHFPDTGVQRRVSTAGGAWPHWREDGKELFYLNGAGHLVAVEVELDGRFSVSPEKIITLDPITSNPYNIAQSFDVRRDGQSYLRWLQYSESDASRLTILRDWVGMLEERE